MATIFTFIPELHLLALAVFVLCWASYSRFADYRHHRSPNLLAVMYEYRLNWMRRMLRRNNRMMDATTIGNLMRSISFFASTSMLILAGLVSLLGYREKAMSLIASIPYAAEQTPLLWEIKILLLSAIFVYAFFKYTWSLRQYHYTAVYIAAAPLEDDLPPDHETYAANGAQLLSNAARHFNLGLRAYYFGIAALTWFVHPLLFIVSSLWVVLVLWRREFHSRILECFVSSPHSVPAEH